MFPDDTKNGKSQTVVKKERGTTKIRIVVLHTRRYNSKFDRKTVDDKSNWIKSDLKKENNNNDMKRQKYIYIQMEPL